MDNPSTTVRHFVGLKVLVSTKKMSATYEIMLSIEIKLDIG